jgi:hypothetical protein
LADATAAMLANWNQSLPTLHSAITHPDIKVPLRLYGTALAPSDEAPIPEADLPPGLPAWMRGLDSWAERTGADAVSKRRTITVTVPADQVITDPTPH